MKKSQNKNLFSTNNIFDNNLFASEGNAFATNPANKTNKNDKVINDFDSSLILENVDLTAKNKAVKINLKINTLEKELARVTEQVELLCLLNLDRDKKKREKFIERKEYIEKQLKQLKDERKNYGIFYSLADFMREKINTINFKKFIDKQLPTIKKIFSSVLVPIKTLRNRSSLFR